MTHPTAQEIIDRTKAVLVSTYDAQPVAMDHGQGCYAYDTDGKKYLDFAAGIAVASLGHANPAILKTIKRQAGRLMACQSSYATPEKMEAAELLVKHSCFDQIYFSNSGTESVEAALKCARKWAYDTKGRTATRSSRSATLPQADLRFGQRDRKADEPALFRALYRRRAFREIQRSGVRQGSDLR